MKFTDILRESKEEWVVYNITDPKNMVKGLDKPYKSRNDASRQKRDEDEVVILKKDYLKLKELKESNQMIVKEGSAEEILRKEKFKIKSVHGTKFGNEYVMAKKYDEDEIKEILSDFTVKFDGNSIFVIN